jgi:hypothetical protein
VNQALYYYRERDEVGLQRFLRSVFKATTMEKSQA